VIGGRTDNKALTAAMLLGPEYTNDEIAHVWDANEFSEKFLLSDVLTTDLSSIRELKCPMILFNGRDDYNVSGRSIAERALATSRRSDRNSV
jgi:hypothetical protein